MDLHGLANQHGVVYVDIRNSPPPPQWGVTISEEAIAVLAEDWSDRQFPLPEWDYTGLPRGLDDESWYDLCIVACSVLACIWPPEGEKMWTTHYESHDLDDAPAVFSCFSRQIKGGTFDLGVFATLSADEFFAGSGTLQLRDEKWEQLNAVVAAIRLRWHGSISRLVAEAGWDAERVVELLASSLPGFRDAPTSSQGTLPFFKLARLATAMMSAGGSRAFSALERLPVYPDYMLPRVLRHFGVLAYAGDLAEAVDCRRLIPKESDWELAIRWATVFAGDRLVDALRSHGVAVSTPALDYALWHSAVLGPDADSMGEHHRTLTLAY